MTEKLPFFITIFILLPPVHITGNQLVYNTATPCSMVYQVTGVQVLDQVAGALVVVNQVAGTQVLDQVAGVHVVVDQVTGIQVVDDCIRMGKELLSMR